MAGDRDVVLLETIKTHRGRLVASMLHGELDQRRVVGSNVRRFVTGLVLAALACAGCAGTAFVVSVLEDQAEARAAEEAARTAPIDPSPAPTAATAEPEAP